MRVAFYGRFSSDKQKDSSIDQQYRNCERFAEREEWVISKGYEDRGDEALPLLQHLGRVSREVVLSRSHQNVNTKPTSSATKYRTAPYSVIPRGRVTDGVRHWSIAVCGSAHLSISEANAAAARPNWTYTPC